MTNSGERRGIDRRTDDIYRKAIEDIRDYAIFMTDPDGVITNWNVGAEHILGYSEEEIIGRDAAKFFTPEDRGERHSAKGIVDRRTGWPGRRRTLAHSP